MELDPVAGFIEHCHKFRGSIGTRADPSGCLRARIVDSNSAESMDSVTCKYCLLSDRGLCDRPIPRPEDSCQMCAWVIECGQL
jgi:hypothetical protein